MQLKSAIRSAARAFVVGLATESHSAAKAAARGRSVRLQRQQELQAAYDSAQTNEFNERYWSKADALSSDEANNPSVRQTLRMRARYECLEANSFAKGIVHTLAADTIGTGPRLQVRTPNRAANERIEQSFNAWAKEVQLARKLRTMRVAKCVDGEAFAQLVTNRKLRHRVMLDVRPFEAEMCSTPTLALEPNAVDGIRFDEFGNPTEYHRLKQHPGGPWAGLGDPLAVEKLDPTEVIHLFRQDRPGQHRGVPEIATALPLFILLRDYTLAVLHNAKSVAKHTAVLETQAGSTTESGDRFDPQVEPFDVVDVDYDMITSLPHGWKLNQLRAEQPATTYKMFRDAILNEIARCVSMPFVIAAADSSGANYSSARLDIQVYDMAIEVERSEWEALALDRILSAWFDEAVLIPGLLPGGLGAFDELPHDWFWDSRGYSDPRHQAQAQAERIRIGVSHRALEYASEGRDVDAEDRKAAESFGLTVEEYRRVLAQSMFNVPQGSAEDTDTPAERTAGDDTPDEKDEAQKPTRRQRARAAA